MNYDLALNDEILINIGTKARKQRLNMNMTVASLSAKSGLSSKTICDFELGKGNISIRNLLEVLRALHLLENLNGLIPDIPIISPLALVDLEKKTRKRARNK